jgi:hypothetical protein
MRRFRQNFREFLFRPDSDWWVTLLRIGLALVVGLYCLSLRRDWNHLFAGSGNGLISRDLTETVLTMDSRFIPTLSWLVDLGSRVGLTEQAALSVGWWLLFAAACCLATGLFCRSAAILAWLVHLCAVKSGDFMSYGIDNFTTIGLFYLMIVPLPDRFALDAIIWKSRPPNAQRLGFHRRVLQIHLCFIYFFSGLTKCLGAGWWSGATLWRALTRPPFNLISPDLLASWRYALIVLGISVCLLEISYAIFIWPRKTRYIWLGCVLAMHVSIGLTMGLYLFALIMIVLNLAAFAPAIPVGTNLNSVAAPGQSKLDETGGTPGL